MKKQKPVYKYNAICSHVIDGDTIEISIDLGFEVSIAGTVRLLGINAPELRGKTKAEGLKSKNALSEMILFKRIVIETVKAKEKYGRYLATVYLDNLNVNQEMIKRGLAVPYMI